MTTKPENGADEPPPAPIRPNPDPTILTTQRLLREVSLSREIIETRLGGMDKAIELLQRTTDKIPDLIKGEVTQLKELHAEKFSSFSAQLQTQCQGIATQFAERDNRTEQLSIADKTAIAAALQAQKEAAAAQNESNATANNKMELNFAKLIEAQQLAQQAMQKNMDDKFNDLKGRQDRGEGSSTGVGNMVGYVFGGVGMLAAIIMAVVVVLKFVGSG